MTIKPIETVYNGYRFRSRLEARWAVFFDALGMPYEYEPEGFDLGETGYYLPDFQITKAGRYPSETQRFWVEVKPAYPLADIEFRRCHDLVAMTKQPCFVLVGVPDYKAYSLILPDNNSPFGTELVLALLHSSRNRVWYIPSDVDLELYTTECEQYQHAVAAARQARFEHGARINY